jgi:hypothetical protein
MLLVDSSCQCSSRDNHPSCNSSQKIFSKKDRPQWKEEYKHNVKKQKIGKHSFP